MASLRSAIHNVRANLSEVQEARRASLENECDVLLLRAIALVNKAMPRIEERMKSA